MVFDNIFEIINVINIPSKTTNNTAIVASSDEVNPEENPPNKNKSNCY